MITQRLPCNFNSRHAVTLKHDFQSIVENFSDIFMLYQLPKIFMKIGLLVYPYYWSAVC